MKIGDKVKFIVNGYTFDGTIIWVKVNDNVVIKTNIGTKYELPKSEVTLA